MARFFECQWVGVLFQVVISDSLLGFNKQTSKIMCSRDPGNPPLEFSVFTALQKPFIERKCLGMLTV